MTGSVDTSGEVSADAGRPATGHGRPAPRGRRPFHRVLLVGALVAALLVAAVVVDETRGASSQPTIVGIAHGHERLRVLLVGDSMAGTLGLGLAQAAPAFGVDLINAAVIGCGVSIAWDGGWASSILVPGPPIPPCQSKRSITTYWEGLIRRYDPEVVVYVDRMDTISQEVVRGSTNRMTSVLDASFQAYLKNAMTQAVQILSSGGAHVLLATSAPTKIGLVGNQYDNPERWLIYDRLLASVAADSHGHASVFNLGRFFGGSGPQPVFSLRSSTGVQWRCSDGIHFTPAGGILVAPELYRLAWADTPSRERSSTHAPRVPSSVANQPWPPFAAEQQTMGCPS